MDNLEDALDEFDSRYLESYYQVTAKMGHTLGFSSLSLVTSKAPPRLSSPLLVLRDSHQDSHNSCFRGKLMGPPKAPPLTLPPPPSVPPISSRLQVPRAKSLTNSPANGTTAGYAEDADHCQFQGSYIASAYQCMKCGGAGGANHSCPSCSSTGRTENSFKKEDGVGRRATFSECRSTGSSPFGKVNVEVVWGIPPMGRRRIQRLFLAPTMRHKCLSARKSRHNVTTTNVGNPFYRPRLSPQKARSVSHRCTAPETELGSAGAPW